ncbi:uncharacterized protein LOC135931101 isoform X6 [Gordionus sp. m RMFG-2023]|uniref:uncharacterized protein LOC135931101 isoform X6 n=1 Tax=Gordionus sp. m RMFG-2023 TaxID=3053472 RepID=UPI0031FCA9B8
MIINITSSYDQETNVTKITETKGILIDVQETPLSSISSKFFIQDDSEREMFYNYDPRKGIHIATFLGSFLILILCFIIYKDKKKIVNQGAIMFMGCAKQIRALNYTLRC